MEEKLARNEELEKTLIKSESSNAYLNQKLIYAAQASSFTTKPNTDQEINTPNNEPEKVFTMSEMKKVLIQLNETQKMLNKKCK